NESAPSASRDVMVFILCPPSTAHGSATHVPPPAHPGAPWRIVTVDRRDALPVPCLPASETEGASLHEHGIRYAPVTVTCPVHFPTHARSERPIPGRSRGPELRESLSSRNRMAHRAVAICWQGRCCVPVVDGATSRGGLMTTEHARETQEQERKGGGE